MYFRMYIHPHLVVSIMIRKLKESAVLVCSCWIFNFRPEKDPITAFASLCIYPDILDFAVKEASWRTVFGWKNSGRLIMMLLSTYLPSWQASPSSFASSTSSLDAASKGSSMSFNCFWSNFCLILSFHACSKRLQVIFKFWTLSLHQIVQIGTCSIFTHHCIITSSLFWFICDFHAGFLYLITYSDDDCIFTCRPGASMDFYIAIGSLLIELCVLIQGLNTGWAEKMYFDNLCQVRCCWKFCFLFYPPMYCVICMEIFKFVFCVLNFFTRFSQHVYSLG